MNFNRKSLGTHRTLILSEKPLFAMEFEERLNSMVPAMEPFVDSFEDYSSAYEHCSKVRTVGMLFLHISDESSLPVNAVDELFAPFEAIGSTAGLVIIASSANIFASAYSRYGNSPRLLGIHLVSDLESDAEFKQKILDATAKFEHIQRKTALPRDELEFFMRTARRFEDIDLLNRLSKILSARLDRDWYDDILIEAGPSVLALPENQSWILKNSPSLQKIAEELAPFSELTTDELINAKDQFVVLRSVALTKKIHESQKAGHFSEFMERNSAGVNAFSPTLKKILASEKTNIILLFNEKDLRKTA